MDPEFPSLARARTCGSASSRSRSANATIGAGPLPFERAGTKEHVHRCPWRGTRSAAGRTRLLTRPSGRNGLGNTQ